MYIESNIYPIYNIYVCLGIEVSLCAFWFIELLILALKCGIFWGKANISNVCVCVGLVKMNEIPESSNITKKHGEEKTTRLKSKVKTKKANCWPFSRPKNKINVHKME